MDHGVAPSLLNEGGRRAVHGDDAKSIVLTKVKRAELCAADPDRFFQHGVEDPPKFARRAGENLKHLRGCGLLFQRLGKEPSRFGKLADPLVELLLRISV